jgi:hypothetical protein
MKIMIKMRIMKWGDFGMMRGMSDVPDVNGESRMPVEAPKVLELAAPVVRRQLISASMQVRIYCAMVLLVCGGMLGVGMWLRPDASGTGTHQQLGLAPCGWYTTWGFPCMTCGCTTAVSHFAHGQLIASFVTQPFGFTVGLVAAILVPLTLIGVATGKWRGPSMFTINWYWRYWLYGGIGILLGAWVYKVWAVRHGIT